MRTSDLIERGWTKGLIDKHLDGLKVRKTGRGFYGSYEYFEFPDSTVQEMECQPDIASHLAKTLARRRIKADEKAADAKAHAEEQERKLRDADVLLALFSANRAAKRNRDNPSDPSCCMNRNEFYAKKNQALVHLLAEGRLAVAGVHRIGQNYAAILRGEGYSFHQPCPPPADASLAEYIGESIESKPRDSKEYDVWVALKVIDRYLEGRPEVKVYCWPDNRTCYSCGKVGHIASRCPDPFSIAAGV